MEQVKSAMHYKPELPQLTLWSKFKFAPEMLSQEGARHPEAGLLQECWASQKCNAL